MPLSQEQINRLEQRGSYGGSVDTTGMSASERAAAEAAIRRGRENAQKK